MHSAHVTPSSLGVETTSSSPRLEATPSSLGLEATVHTTCRSVVASHVGLLSCSCISTLGCTTAALGLAAARGIS